MKIVSLIHIGFLMVCKFSFAQDTIVTKERYLIGTSVLTGSNRNSESCILNGYCFDKLIKHPCLSTIKETPDSSKIKSVIRRNDSLLISLQIYENCAYDFLGEIEIIDKNSLNIILHEYGSFASCMCTFDVDCIILIKNEEVENPIKIETVILDNKDYTKFKIDN